jgi:2-polyprenyl-3-methyl-5-hydroxy-6-metoxy-1,4-benzoquinol methylase
MHKHIPVSQRKIIEVTNSIEGTSFKNYKDLEQVMLKVKARLHRRWLESKCTDFSVYRDPQYHYEGTHCFEKSRGCTGGVIQYFQRMKSSNVVNGRMIDTRVVDGIWYTGKDPSKMSVLDVYNGNGLTSVHMALNGFKQIETFNDCEPQVAFMNKVTEAFNLSQIKNHTVMPTKKYDLVLSFEVLEHYTDPLVHVADLLKLTKPGSYLAESSGFNGSSDNIGHFDTYEIEGHGVVDYRQARRITTRAIQMHFTKVFDGFNRMPKIWVRN